ncbi:stage V sporulation protein SpoVM [Sporosarcina sp. P10]|uniref:stage V sporulation protein SpoVM n=1 Tax=unclassified Sporosarcina TaxID=2647733 RepID=UPI00350F34CB
MGDLRVYTFTLPKFVSNIVRKCAVAFQKDSRTKSTVAANSKAAKTKKRKKEKTQSA